MSSMIWVLTIEAPSGGVQRYGVISQKIISMEQGHKVQMFRVADNQRPIFRVTENIMICVGGGRGGGGGGRVAK